ncbi:MAG: hypothetical protein KIS78_14070 [Labilithrix sp.]|nr:hypothetical protein [Labilithrix sp.]
MLTSRARLALTLSAALLAPARALAQPAPSPSASEPTPDAPGSEDGWESPALAADPPILPPPSRSAPPPPSAETDVGASEPPAPAAAASSDREREAEKDARLRALEARVAEDERRIEKLEGRLGFLKHLRLESFIQPQLLVQTYNSAASPNLQPNGELPIGIGANDTIAKIDGTTTNGTFFRVRRARMRTFYETDVMKLFLQIDALPAGGVGPGIGTILRNAEASGIVRWTRDVRTEFTAGLFFTPFRAELLEASVNRPFIERTWFIQNVFPIERDYGAKARTIALDHDRLVVELAAVNGQRLGERNFVALPDLNRSKDFIAYATYRVGFVTLGASGYLGRGQIVDGQALRFKQYSKWAVNYQASAAYRLLRGIGESRLSSELTIARNMDAGVIYPFAVPAIPARFTDDVAHLDQRALYVRAEQDIKRHVTLGYRYDMYTPDTAIKNNARDTHAFLAVWKVSPNLRFMSELGWAIDNVHPFGAPAPSKHIVYFSNVLQAMF